MEASGRNRVSGKIFDEKMKNSTDCRLPAANCLSAFSPHLRRVGAGRRDLRLPTADFLLYQDKTTTIMLLMRQ